MTQQQPATAGTKEADPFNPPAVIVLGNAATLTRGSDQKSIESKQNPYD